jgi:hypothetical protein
MRNETMSEPSSEAKAPDKMQGDSSRVHAGCAVGLIAEACARGELVHEPFNSRFPVVADAVVAALLDAYVVLLHRNCGFQIVRWH